MDVQNKRILNEITKRWIKGIISSNEAMISFDESGLSSEEIDYIQSKSDEIAARITSKEVNTSVNDLVKEYFTFEDEE